jgi:hypothetical protein
VLMWFMCLFAVTSIRWSWILCGRGSVTLVKIGGMFTRYKFSCSYEYSILN